MFNVCHQKSVSVLVVFCVLILPQSVSVGQEPNGIRRMAIPHCDGGYRLFESQVVGTQKQFDDFLKSVEKKDTWDRHDQFLIVLKNAKIDFTIEALALIRRTEGSSTIKVAFPSSELKGEKLVCRITRELPVNANRAIVDYCLALVVPNKHVASIEILTITDDLRTPDVREILKLQE